MHISTWTNLYAQIHSHTEHLYVHAQQTFIQAQVHMHIPTVTHIHTDHIYIHAYFHTCFCTHIPIHTCLHAHVHTHAHLYIYMYTNTLMYSCIYTQICTPPYICAHIYAHTPEGYRLTRQRIVGTKMRIKMCLKVKGRTCSKCPPAHLVSTCLHLFLTAKVLRNTYYTCWISSVLSQTSTSLCAGHIPNTPETASLVTLFTAILFGHLMALFTVNFFLLISLSSCFP